MCTLNGKGIICSKSIGKAIRKEYDPSSVDEFSQRSSWAA